MDTFKFDRPCSKLDAALAAVSSLIIYISIVKPERHGNKIYIRLGVLCLSIKTTMKKNKKKKKQELGLVPATRSDGPHNQVLTCKNLGTLHSFVYLPIISALGDTCYFCIPWLCSMLYFLPAASEVRGSVLLLAK